MTHRVFSTQAGAMVEEGQDEGYQTHDNYLQAEKLAGRYCGTCESTVCMVDSQQACCHDMVRYGECRKHSRGCAVCFPDPCLVDAGIYCCHDKIRNGYCRHDPEEEEK